MRKTYLLALFLAASAGLAVGPGQAAPGAAKAEDPQPTGRRHRHGAGLGRDPARQGLRGAARRPEERDRRRRDARSRTSSRSWTTSIKALQDELEKQGSVLSPDAADKKRQEIVRKTRDRQAFLEDGQQELQRMRDRAQQQAQSLENDFQVKIKPHIDAVVEGEGHRPPAGQPRSSWRCRRTSTSPAEVIVKADDAERAAKAKAPAAPTGPKAPRSRPTSRPPPAPPKP